MRIKSLDPSNTSKFWSEYLNSVNAFVGQVPLTGIETIAIKEKCWGKSKKVSKFVGLGLPAGEKKSSNFIVNGYQ